MRVELQTSSRRRRRHGRRTSMRPAPRRAARRARLPRLVWMLPAVLLLLAVAYIAYTALRSTPGLTVSATARTTRFRGRLGNLGWPAHGQAAVAVEGVALLGARGDGRATPIASLAKVMTAYLVLHDHPLRSHESGPTLEITPGDVAAYRADRAGGQSVVAVRAGERLTERQALDGLLLPSGNNLASLLAAWDAGSQHAFIAKMNATAPTLGLKHTHYSDASGLQPGTVSTATDQVRLAMRAMALPAFRQTVGMTQAVMPIAGRVFNLDQLLGHDGIIGIKTGTTGHAGGCFLFAARARIGGRPVTLTGAVLHQMATGAQPSILAAALQATTRLLNSSRRVLVRRRVLRAGTTLASVSAPWGGPVPLRAGRSVSLSGWPGLRVTESVSLSGRLTPPVTRGEMLGHVVVTAGSQRAIVPLVAAGAIGAPSYSWRLAHP